MTLLKLQDATRGRMTLHCRLMVAMAALLTLLPQLMRADNWTNFFTDVMVAGGSSKSVRNQSGWQSYDQDLNKGAGGDYIYLLYKRATTDTPSTGFISDLKVVHGSQGYQERFTDENGVEWIRSSYTGDSHSYFEPNNLWGEQYETTFDLSTGGTKYPIHTQLEVSLPGNPSYEDTKNDLVYAFVGDECRGILMPSAETKGFEGIVYSRTEGEQAQLRYYRASQKGYYTLKQLIDLNGLMQNVVFEY